MKKTAVFTIASKNYFAFVTTLMKSLKATNPNWDRYVVVVDDIDEEFRNMGHDFSLIDLKNLKLPEENKMKFRYTIMEFNTAVKPFAIDMLMDDYERVVYIDPDIVVYEEMKEVNEAFNKGANFILTPHLLDFYPDDGLLPDEPYIMRAGIYNLGFIGLQKSVDSRKLVKWWMKKLVRQCIVDLPAGIFVDQKWMDFVPGIFENVHIIRDAGYNVAYWNLSHRKITKKKDKFFINGNPLVFFHFSGVDPDHIENVSRHQNRYVLKDLGVGAELFEDYSKRVKTESFDFWKKYKYSYARFTDGAPIKDEYRFQYRQSKELETICGDNPFNMHYIFARYMKEFHNGYESDSFQELLEIVKVINNYDKVVIRGCGIRGKYLLQSLDEIGIKKPIIVTDKNDIGKDVCGYTIESPDSIDYTQENVIYIITPIYHREEIMKELIFKGASIKSIRIFDRSPLRLVEFENEDGYIELESGGVNVIGYLTSEHGVGEAGRMTARCLEKAGVKWAGVDFETNNISRKADVSLCGRLSNDLKYTISIINLNADQLIEQQINLPKYVNLTYRIGIWYWELPIFPQKWLEAFNYVDEIWAPTLFIKECLEKVATVPVYHMPPGITINKPSKLLNRDFFKLPPKQFLFISMFDVLSCPARKNPISSIVAFKRAFKKNNENVGLVLKINNYQYADEEEIMAIKDAIGEYKNIYIIDRTLSREEVYGLIQSCDALISLHRSEGLGLPCEEAMLLKKPVIATAWSGNMDFMTNENSCLVEYSMTNVGEDMGSYEKWQEWAEPSVESAVTYMRKLVMDTEYYKTIAENGYKTISKEFSPKKCGDRMKDALIRIKYGK